MSLEDCAVALDAGEGEAALRALITCWRARPSVEAWARCAAEKASLMKTSPSEASWLTKSSSFFSSPA